MPGILLHAEDTTMAKKYEVLTFMNFIFYGRRNGKDNEISLNFIYNSKCYSENKTG